MEVVTENEATTRILLGQSLEIGRAHGLDSSDKTISRRHLSLSVAGDTNGEEIRLQFEVLGRNPIYVYRDGEVKIFRRFESGEMRKGDMLCVSGKNPVWYSVRATEDCGEGVRQNVSESDSGIVDFDISGLDPVKEFGFVVEGLEFDGYPKKMMRDIQNWNWFVEEEVRDGEDDNGKKVKGKRKRGGGHNDDEWSGESEDEKALMNKSRKARREKYVTRSEDRHGKMSSTRTDDRVVDNEEEDRDNEDEDDETLGGFVVDDEKVEEEEENETEEEEEDFEDEDEDEDE
ncbi:chromatin modification-related protein EAF7 [Salvia splendens]|uniref:chromatin modification-related protein EAF7 n=1 Tax=Salvia splendens TaxID=180675 RepID=UPI0011011F4E|nr:chromatin modification-related protein EAF7 [Salvia splendens]